MFASKKMIQTYLRNKGLNIIGGFVPNEHEFDHILPNCRSVFILANGGSLLFDQFIQDVQKYPKHLSHSSHPIDDFVQRCIRDLPNDMDGAWVMCSQQSPTVLNFMSLAKRAGLGWESHLGILIHPIYGLWIGLRAAFFSTSPLEDIQKFASQHQKTKNPCMNCHKPCISGCHYNAVDENGWNMLVCAQAHLLQDRKTVNSKSLCFSSCDARRSCPIGKEYQHSDLQHHYHYHRPSGRKRLAKNIGIVDEMKGDGPYWHWAFLDKDEGV